MPSDAEPAGQELRHKSRGNRGTEFYDALGLQYALPCSIIFTIERVYDYVRPLLSRVLPASLS